MHCIIQHKHSTIIKPLSKFKGLITSYYYLIGSGYFLSSAVFKKTIKELSTTITIYVNSRSIIAFGFFICLKCFQGPSSYRWYYFFCIKFKICYPGYMPHSAQHPKKSVSSLRKTFNFVRSFKRFSIMPSGLIVKGAICDLGQIQSSTL